MLPRMKPLERLNVVKNVLGPPTHQQSEAHQTPDDSPDPPPNDPRQTPPLIDLILGNSHPGILLETKNPGCEVGHIRDFPEGFEF